METELVKLFTPENFQYLGWLGIALVLIYLLRVWLPQQAKEDREERERQRQEHLQNEERQRQEHAATQKQDRDVFREILTEQRKDYLDAQHCDRLELTDILKSQQESNKQIVHMLQDLHAMLEAHQEESRQRAAQTYHPKTR